METINCSSPEELYRSTAEVVVEELSGVLARERFATLTLAGGSTPRGLYALLAQTDQSILPWESIHLLWGDERVVPPDSIDSNYRMARESLLSRIRIPETNIHRVRTELGAEEAARDYESTIGALCGTRRPMLDVVLLGIGPDGHTASLFPGQPQLEARTLVAPTPPASREPRVRRVTMTYRLLASASLVLFLVSGEEKTPIVRAIMEGGEGAAQYPASRIRPSGRLILAVYPPTTVQ